MPVGANEESSEIPSITAIDRIASSVPYSL